MPKYTILGVLVFVLVLQGCSFLGIDLEDDRTIAVQKSPYIIVMEGDLERDDYKAMETMLKFLENKEYKDSNFTSWQLKFNTSDVIQETKLINNIGGAKSPEDDLQDP